MKPRPPIVVVMGHVDHGKTTLLDYVRKTNVAARESGSITQAVGAYEIIHTQTNPSMGSGQAARKITFIDTPGHEAFSKMRSRGAEVADLAILVVAADEGVKPQTKESVNILNESKTPFIVAVTKIDKPGADIEKVKNELTAIGVLLEGYGGQISYHGVSSKSGDGINDLLDLILLSADLENLTFDPAAPASGYVLESGRDPRRGMETSVIVRNGTLKRGDDIYTPTAKGKVKILENFLGKIVDKLEPSSPALIIGFEQLPAVGETFSTLLSAYAATAPVSSRKSEASKSEKPTLNLILKAGDSGSLEALSSVVGAMSSEERPIEFIDQSVGDVTDNDSKNAIATGAVIMGFKNKVDKGARNLAEAHEVKIITSDIIYDLVKTIEEFFGNLDKLTTVGELEILAVFNQKKPEKQLVGGKVLSGIFRNKAAFEVIRKTNEEEKIEGRGRILNLKEKKIDIGQAESGKEIGLLVNCPVLIKAGDKLVIRK